MPELCLFLFLRGGEDTRHFLSGEAMKVGPYVAYHTGVSTQDTCPVYETGGCQQRGPGDSSATERKSIVH